MAKGQQHRGGSSRRHHTSSSHTTFFSNPAFKGSRRVSSASAATMSRVKESHSGEGDAVLDLAPEMDRAALFGGYLLAGRSRLAKWFSPRPDAAKYYTRFVQLGDRSPYTLNYQSHLLLMPDHIEGRHSLSSIVPTHLPMAIDKDYAIQEEDESDKAFEKRLSRLPKQNEHHAKLNRRHWNWQQGLRLRVRHLIASGKDPHNPVDQETMLQALFQEAVKDEHIRFASQDDLGAAVTLLFFEEVYTYQTYARVHTDASLQALTQADQLYQYSLSAAFIRTPDAPGILIFDPDSNPRFEPPKPPKRVKKLQAPLKSTAQSGDEITYLAPGVQLNETRERVDSVVDHILPGQVAVADDLVEENAYDLGEAGQAEENVYDLGQADQFDLATKLLETVEEGDEEAMYDLGGVDHEGDDDAKPVALDDLYDLASDLSAAGQGGTKVDLTAIETGSAYQDLDDELYDNMAFDAAGDTVLKDNALGDGDSGKHSQSPGRTPPSSNQTGSPSSRVLPPVEEQISGEQLDDYLDVAAESEPDEEPQYDEGNAENGLVALTQHPLDEVPPIPTSRRPSGAMPSKQEAPRQLRGGQAWEDAQRQEKPVPPSPYNDADILPETFYYEVVRKVRACMAANSENSLSDIANDLIRYFRSENIDAAEMKAYRVIAEITSREVPIPGYNYLQGLGVDDELFTPLDDLLLQATDEYKRFHAPDREAALNMSSDNLMLLHSAIIKLYLKLLGDSAERHVPFQIFLLTPMNDAEGKKLADNFHIVVKRPNRQDDILTTEYRLNVDTGERRADFTPASKSKWRDIQSYNHWDVNLAKSGKVITPEESFDHDPDAYVMIDAKQRRYCTASCATVAVSANRADMQAALLADFKASLKNDNMNIDTLDEMQRLLKEIHFYRETAIEHHLPKALELGLKAFKLNHPDHTPDARGITIMKASLIKKLGNDFMQRMNEATPQVGVVEWADITRSEDIKTLQRAVVGARAAATLAVLSHRFQTDLSQASFLLEKQSRSTMQYYLNGYQPYSRWEDRKDWIAAHPVKTALIGLGAVVVASGAAYAAYNVLNQPASSCGGFQDGEGQCQAPVAEVSESQLPNAECRIDQLSSNAIDENGQISFQVICDNLDVVSTNSETSFRLTNIPAGAQVTLPSGETVNHSSGALDVPADALNKTIQVKLPVGFNRPSGWTIEGEIERDSGAIIGDKQSFQAMQTVVVNPVAGVASTSLLSADLTVLENQGSIGSASSTDSISRMQLRVSPADGDSAANLYIEDLPEGATVSVTLQNGQTLIFESTLDNNGTSILAENIQGDVDLSMTPPPHSSQDFTAKVFSRSKDGSALGPRGNVVDLNFVVQGVANTPLSVEAPTVLRLVEGDWSPSFNISGVVSEGDTLGRRVILPPGGQLRNSNGQTYVNSGQTQRTVDITQDPIDNWQYRGEHRFSVQAYASDEASVSSSLSQTVNLNVFPLPTVTVRNPSTNSSLTSINFAEDTVADIMLQVNAPQANTTRVILQFPKPTVDFASSTYRVNGTLPSGDSVFANATANLQNPNILEVDVSAWDLTHNSIGIRPPQDVNRGNQAGNIPMNIKLTSIDDSGLEATQDVMSALSLDISPVPGGATIQIIQAIHTAPGPSVPFGNGFVFPDEAQESVLNNQIHFFGVPGNTSITSSTGGVLNPSEGHYIASVSDLSRGRLSYTGNFCAQPGYHPDRTVGVRISDNGASHWVNRTISYTIACKISPLSPFDACEVFGPRCTT